ncbi:MAG TPA: fasciclin domain-containing protein [Polyangiaceae bacterium]|nr:fasciclin domain-containing protein [Polyangiaceae bacterium]
MKYLPWLSMMLVASFPVVGCSSDSGGSAGSVATAGNSSGSSPGAAGAAAGQGGSGGSAEIEGKDLIDTAVGAGNFTKLAAALTSAGLVEALKGPGPFTVFAPDDAAFAAFESANPGVLAGLSKAALTEILTYHVVAGAAVASKDLKDEQVFTTLSGSPVLIDSSAGVKVDDAKVITADVVASNGVIHVIDRLILPPKDDIVATAIAAGTFTKLASALTAADLVTTLQGKGPFTVFAPTDTAFAKLPAVPSGEALKNVLLYHVVAGAVGSGDLKAGPVPTQLTGKSVTVSLTDGVRINDSKVTAANILAKNGVIHVVDTVLIPQ